MNGFEFVCKHYDVAVLNVPEVFGDEFFDSVSIYGQKGSEEEREKQDMCGTAKHVENEFFTKVSRAALGITFELFEMPV